VNSQKNIVDLILAILHLNKFSIENVNWEQQVMENSSRKSLDSLLQWLEPLSVTCCSLLQFSMLNLRPCKIANMRSTLFSLLFVFFPRVLLVNISKFNVLQIFVETAPTPFQKSKHQFEIEKQGALTEREGSVQLTSSFR
jgi:hypothetical protein